MYGTSAFLRRLSSFQSRLEKSFKTVYVSVEFSVVFIFYGTITGAEFVIPVAKLMNCSDRAFNNFYSMFERSTLVEDENEYPTPQA